MTLPDIWYHLTNQPENPEKKADFFGMLVQLQVEISPNLKWDKEIGYQQEHRDIRIILMRRRVDTSENINRPWPVMIWMGSQCKVTWLIHNVHGEITPRWRTEASTATNKPEQSPVLRQLFWVDGLLVHVRMRVVGSERQKQLETALIVHLGRVIVLKMRKEAAKTSKQSIESYSIDNW